MASEYDPNGLNACLSRIEERQKTNAVKLEEMHNELVTVKESHETRIQSLERWRVWVVGICAGVGLAAHALLDFAKGFFTTKQ